MKYLLLLTTLLLSFQSLTAQDTTLQQENHDHLYTEVGFTFSHFEQQVKSKIGGVKGDLLVDDTNLSFSIAGGYHLLKWLSLGVNVRYDAGTRNSGSFDGIDSDGATIVTNRLGGDYSELWIAPYARLHYRKLFFAVGYGLVGSRADEGRNDIPSKTGSVAENFSLDPSVALLFNLGGSAAITDDLEVIFGIEYRARYYNQRGGNALQNDIVLGTQNFTPLMGVRYSL